MAHMGFLSRSDSMAFWRSAFVGSSLVLIFGLGCQSAPKQVVAPLPPPATEEQAGNVQSEMQEHDPNSRTGLVTQVRPQDELAVVALNPAGDARGSKINVGDIFTFVDSTQKLLANGKAISVDGELIVVSYLPTAEGRHPKEGDIAVHLSMK
jgi:hypothetical protein